MESETETTKLTPNAQSPIPDDRLTGEERHQLIAYRQEIKKLKIKLDEEKKFYEGCNSERLEALNRAGLAEMEVKVFRRAVAFLKQALQLKANSGGAIKKKIREYLKAIGVNNNEED